MFKIPLARLTTTFLNVGPSPEFPDERYRVMLAGRHGEASFRSRRQGAHPLGSSRRIHSLLRFLVTRRSLEPPAVSPPAHALALGGATVVGAGRGILRSQAPAVSQDVTIGT